MNNDNKILVYAKGREIGDEFKKYFESFGINLHYVYTLGDLLNGLKSNQYHASIVLNLAEDRIKLLTSKAEISNTNPMIMAMEKIKDDSTVHEVSHIFPIKWPLDIKEMDSTIQKIGFNKFGIKSLLMVEDETINQEIVKKILEGKGHRLVIVSNGAAALREIKNYKPDLILLDFMLPDINGDEILYWVRGRYKKSELPVVVISSQDDMSNVKKLADLGVEGYLVKPFQPEKFLHKINSAISKNDTKSKQVA